jgi:hypothetical protein
VRQRLPVASKPTSVPALVLTGSFLPFSPVVALVHCFSTGDAAAVATALHSRRSVGSTLPSVLFVHSHGTERRDATHQKLKATCFTRTSREHTRRRPPAMILTLTVPYPSAALARAARTSHGRRLLHSRCRSKRCSRPSNWRIQA